MLNICLNEKGQSVKIQLPNIFKEHHIVAQPTHTTEGYDEWPLSLAPWRKFYNSYGKYKLELNEYFPMYRCQLNFSMFCATSALGISWQHLNDPNLLVRAVYKFHVYFHVRLILHELHISLPHEYGFSKGKNAYERSVYYSVCNQYGVNPDETWMYGDWFCMTDYVIFGHEVKATEKSPPDNLTQWIITKSKGFTKKGIEKISKSVMAFIYLVLICQMKTRSTIEKYQEVLEHALSKVDFSVGTSIYMLPSNPSLNIGRKK